MSELIARSVPEGLASDRRGGLDAQLKELYSLSAEIVDLFYTQAFSPDTISTPADVCAAFSEIILRHWDLCCIAIYLRDDMGRLRETALHAHEHFDEAQAREVGTQFAAALEERNKELQAWVDENDAAAGNGAGEDSLRRTLEETGFRAGVAVPIHVRGTLVGALIAVTVFPERLRAALNGIRFIAAPVVIAVGNARRAAVLREHDLRIEHLVEQLQEHGRALEEANRELRRVANYRSLFLARMSHELRTPLTSILGFAEILLDHEDLTECQRRFCEKIQSSGLQLQTSLNQLVDLSRIEAGQSEVFLHEFSLSEVLNESCAAVERLARKQGVKIVCVPDERMPSIVSDEGKLRQVLYNFFLHAINRSPEGATINIGAESLSPTRFLIRIEDEGDLLSDTSRFFEPVETIFATETMSNINELGLVISRRLIDLLGGTVELENATPHGLKVLIELPIRPTEGKERVKKVKAKGRKKI